MGAWYSAESAGHRSFFAALHAHLSFEAKFTVRLKLTKRMLA